MNVNMSFIAIHFKGSLTKELLNLRGYEVASPEGTQQQVLLHSGAPSQYKELILLTLVSVVR
jgi:hypothetical protein